MLQVVYSEGLSAQEIMDLDKKMLDEIKAGSSAILHFYDWKNPSITYGHFIDPQKYLNMENIKKLNIDLARRPTGGGIVFHLWDMAFSFLLPSSHEKFSLNTLENYFFVNSVVLSAVKDFLKGNFPFRKSSSDTGLFNEDSSPPEGILISDERAYSEEERKEFATSFCMTGPTKFDVTVQGKKVAGAAQRRTKKGYLHQGMIALTMPDKKLLADLLLDKNTISFMEMNTFALFSKLSEETYSKKENLKNVLIAHFKKKLF